MWIEKKATLHVFELGTDFNAATFLRNYAVEGVWEACVACWAALYIGFPIKMRVNQGNAYISVR